MNMTENEILSKIVKNELTIRNAISNGHRSNIDDEFQKLRIENENLRCLYFGEDSSHCKRNYSK